jgi:hypothetical protein
MTPEEWKAAIETIGGQVLDVPPDHIETVTNYVAEWQAAHREYQEAELLMQAHLKFIFPQIVGWEYQFDAENNRVTLLFKKDKK